jgi:hypothetical protein
LDEGERSITRLSTSEVEREIEEVETGKLKHAASQLRELNMRQTERLQDTNEKLEEAEAELQVKASKIRTLEQELCVTRDQRELLELEIDAVDAKNARGVELARGAKSEAAVSAAHIAELEASLVSETKASLHLQIEAEAALDKAKYDAQRAGDALRDDLSWYVSELAQLRTQITKVQEHVATLEREREQGQRALAEEIRKMQQLRELNAELAGRLCEAQAGAEAAVGLQTELEVGHIKNARLELELSEERCKAWQLQEFNHVNTSRVRELQTALDEHVTVTRHLCDEAEKRDSKNAAEAVQLGSDLAGALALAESHTRASAANVDELQAEKQRSGMLQEQLTHESKRVQQLQEVNQMQRIRIKETQEAAKSCGVELERAVVSKCDVGAELGLQTRRNAELQDELEEAHKATALLRELNRVRTDRFKTLESDVEEAHQAAGAAQRQLADAESRTHELQASLAVAHASLETLRENEVCCEAGWHRDVEKNRVDVLEKREEEMRQFAGSSVSAQCTLSQLMQATRRELKHDNVLVQQPREAEQALDDVNTTLDDVSQWKNRHAAASETTCHLEEQALKRFPEAQDDMQGLRQDCAGFSAFVERGVPATALETLGVMPSELQSGSMCALLSLDARNSHVLLGRCGSISFGRDGTSTVVLEDKDISHRHARIFYDPEFDAVRIADDLKTPFVLEDRSSNGVFINFEKLGRGRRHRLRHGDTVWMSKLALKTPTTQNAYVFQMVPARNVVSVSPRNMLKAGKQGHAVDANNLET